MRDGLRALLGRMVLVDLTVMAGSWLGMQRVAASVEAGVASLSQTRAAARLRDRARELEQLIEAFAVREQ